MSASLKSRRFRGWTHFFEWVLSILLLFGAVTAIVLFALVAYFTFADQVPDRLAKEIEIEVDSRAYQVGDPGDSLQPFAIEYVEIRLPLPVDNPELYVTHSGISLVGVLIGVAAAFQLRQFVRSLRLDHPFILANAHRLRCVAWLMLFGGIWKGASPLFIALEISDVFPNLDFNVSVSGEVIPMIFILMLFIIAEVFAVGVKMKEDADLTV